MVGARPARAPVTRPAGTSPRTRRRSTGGWRSRRCSPSAPVPGPVHRSAAAGRRRRLVDAHQVLRHPQHPGHQRVADLVSVDLVARQQQQVRLGRGGGVEAGGQVVERQGQPVPSPAVGLAARRVVHNQLAASAGGARNVGRVAGPRENSDQSMGSGGLPPCPQLVRVDLAGLERAAGRAGGEHRHPQVGPDPGRLDRAPSSAAWAGGPGRLTLQRDRVRPTQATHTLTLVRSAAAARGPRRSPAATPAPGATSQAARGPPEVPPTMRLPRHPGQAAVKRVIPATPLWVHLFV